MRTASEAVTATVWVVKHGKVMTNIDAQVLENPSNPFKRIRSLDTESKGTAVSCVKQSVLVWEVRLPKIFYLMEL